MGKKKTKSNLKEKLHWIFGHIMALISIILVIVAFGGAYYFVIAPNLVSKPFIEKPYLSKDALELIKEEKNVINASHINYLINEIGAYKLKKPFGTNNYPIMEFFLTDIGKRYYSYVKEHIPVTKEGNPKKEDIIIKVNQETAFNILQSDNIIRAVKEANDNGKIQTELVADMKTLAAKGYFSIYDSIK